MDPGEEWEELESWEPVTAEREEWIRLIHHLEGLTLLSNAVGQGEMRKLPPAPWTATSPQSPQEGGGIEEGEDDLPPEEGEDRRLDVGSLQIVLLGEGETISYCHTEEFQGSIFCDGVSLVIEGDFPTPAVDFPL